MPYPAAFDEQGDIRYMMRFRPRGYGFFPVANDRFIVMERQTLLPTQLIPHSTQMYEMDYLGRVYRTYYVPNGIHHDVCEMTPGGNLLVASNSQCGHVEDCIAEVNRETGKIEKVLDKSRFIFRREIFIRLAALIGKRTSSNGYWARKICGKNVLFRKNFSRRQKICHGIFSSIQPN